MRYFSLIILTVWLVGNVGCAKKSGTKPFTNTLNTNPTLASNSLWTEAQLGQSQEECVANGNASGGNPMNYAAFCGCVYDIIALNVTYDDYLASQDAILQQVQAQGIDSMCMNSGN